MAPDSGSARSRSSATGHTRPTAVSPATKGVFRKEGEFWSIGSSEKAFRLKDSKGLGYLAHLLRHPGTEFHVLDLVGGIGGNREHDEPDPEARSLPRGDEALQKAGL